jgi:hypothetical protein
MKRKHWLAVGLVLGLVGLVIPGPRGWSVPYGCAVGPTVLVPGEVWTCPLWEVANHGTYCTYYAERCSNEYVNLDWDCGKQGNCGSPTTMTCLKIEASQAIQKPTHFYFDKLTQGLTVTEKPSLDPRPAGAKKFTELVGGPRLIDLETKPGKYTAKVMLYTIAVDPKKINQKQPFRIIGTGLEVKTKTAADEKVKHNAIIYVDGKVCRVQLASLVYQVVLHQNTPIDPPAKLPKKD